MNGSEEKKKIVKKGVKEEGGGKEEGGKGRRRWKGRSVWEEKDLEMVEWSRFEDVEVLEEGFVV